MSELFQYKATFHGKSGHAAIETYDKHAAYIVRQKDNESGKIVFLKLFCPLRSMEVTIKDNGDESVIQFDVFTDDSIRSFANALISAGNFICEHINEQ